MNRQVKRYVKVSYRNEREKEKRVNDLLTRGYTFVKEGIDIVCVDKERTFKVDGQHKSSRPRPNIDTHMASYVVMRMSDEMYGDLKLKYGGKK